MADPVQGSFCIDQSFPASAASEDDESATLARSLGTPLTVRIDRKSAAFRDTLAQWRHISRAASPLFAPELSLLTAELTEEREAFLVGAACAGSLSLVLPIARRDRRLIGLRSEHTPRIDAVGDARAMPTLWDAIRQIRGWDVLELRSVPSDSALARRLPELAEGHGYRTYVREMNRSPWFEVDGIEERIHRRFRGDMRRLERQLGGIELERIGRFDRAAFNDVLRLEAAGWKRDAGTAIACEPNLVRFYATAARVFAARGQLTLGFLRARGARIAACLALEDKTTFHLLKIGYDPEYAHFGPGQLLVRETARDAAERGLSRYDLLGKDAPYKMKWTDRARAHVEIKIYAPTPRGSALRWSREIIRPAAGRTARALWSRVAATANRFRSERGPHG